MPSKRRSGTRPSQDRTDTRDTRKTIGPFYNRENLRRNIYIYIYIYVYIYIYRYIVKLHFCCLYPFLSELYFVKFSGLYATIQDKILCRRTSNSSVHLLGFQLYSYVGNNEGLTYRMKITWKCIINTLCFSE